MSMPAVVRGPFIEQPVCEHSFVPNRGAANWSVFDVTGEAQFSLLPLDSLCRGGGSMGFRPDSIADLYTPYISAVSGAVVHHKAA